jgi:hypothetical protein
MLAWNRQGSHGSEFGNEDEQRYSPLEHATSRLLVRSRAAMQKRAA